MRTDGVSSNHAAIAARDTREVEPQRTSVSRADLRESIGRAYAKVTGKPATGEVLDVLVAHASLETASGSHMYNFNFGGIKGRGPDGATARCRTHEVLNGKDVVIRDGFRAYKTLDEGAVDYVRLMRDRFSGAVARAEQGDVDGFAHALKQANYYTADERAYATGLRGLMGLPAGELTQASHTTLAYTKTQTSNASNVVAGGATTPSEFADGPSLSRVMDAIGRHRPTIEREEDDT